MSLGGLPQENLGAFAISSEAVSLSVMLAYAWMILCDARAIAWTSELTIVCQTMVRTR